MNDTPFSYVTSTDLAEGTLSRSSNLLFNTASDFSHFIEQTAIEEGKTCTAVILDYCDDKDIEPGDISKLVSPSLKGKIHMEMIDAGLLADHARLED